MNTKISTTITFSAIAEEKQGKAILLLECKQGKELLFEKVYMPLSQTRLKLLNAKTKKVEVTIPEWLFNSKMDEKEAFEADIAILDQLGLLTEDDANYQPAEKVLDRLDEERPE